MTTVPNLNPIPVVTGDDLLISHDITTNRSGRIAASVLKEYINTGLASDEISYSFGTVEDQLDKSTRIISNITALATTGGFIGDKVYLLGHTVAGVGGGFFIAKSSSGLTNNNGTVVVNGALAWVRELSGFVTPQMFGSYPGASRAVNDAAFSAAINSGIRTLFIPNGIYQLSAKIVITAASLGIAIIGEDFQNTVLSWHIDTGTTNKFAFLLDAFVTIKNLHIENTGNDLANSGGFVSYSPTVENGFRDSRVENIKFTNWHAGIGASIDGTSLTMVRSLVFSNIFDVVIFDGCWIPIKLGSSCNSNVWRKAQFLNNKGPRHIYILEGSTNTFISAQFEPVAPSVTSGFLNAELVLSPNCSFINPYLEPCYGFVADSSPGTHIDGAFIEGFDFSVGTLSNNALLRSINVSNAGVYASPMINRVSLPVCRASSNPTSYCASDDNSNTITLVDGLTSRDVNFKLKPPTQKSKISINTQGTWTPSLIGSGGGGAGNSYSQRSGVWIRNGDLVTAWFRIALSAKDGALSGNVLISGFPFNIANISLYSPSGIFSEWVIDTSAGYTSLHIEGIPNSANFLVTQTGDNVPPLAVDVSAVSPTSIFIGQVSYITDSV